MNRKLRDRLLYEIDRLMQTRYLKTVGRNVVTVPVDPIGGVAIEFRPDKLFPDMCFAVGVFDLNTPDGRTATVSIRIGSVATPDIVVGSVVQWCGAFGVMVRPKES